MSIENNYSGETVTVSVLVGYLESLTVVMIKDERAFAGPGKKIRLPTTEVFLRTAVGDISKSKNIRNWTELKDVLLSLFLTKAIVFDGETVEGELFKKSNANILEWGLE